jgi:hypothetical protein
MMARRVWRKLPGEGMAGLAGRGEIVTFEGFFTELKVPYGNIIATFSVGFIRQLSDRSLLRLLN